MKQVSEFFEQLFSVDGWPARWYYETGQGFTVALYCFRSGNLGCLFYNSCSFDTLNKEKITPSFTNCFLLFGAFYTFLWTDTSVDAIIFWWPAYRLSAMFYSSQRLFHGSRLLLFYKYLPFALSLKTDKGFETELLERKNLNQNLLVY